MNINNIYIWVCVGVGVCAIVANTTLSFQAH